MPTLSDLEQLRALLPEATEDEVPLIQDALTRMEVELHAQDPAAEPAFIDTSFPHQAAFLLDESRFLAMVGPRRKGKSNTIARKMLRRAWRHPAGAQGFQSLYVGLTGGQARKTFWEAALKPTIRALGIDADLNENEMTCRLPNGHMIYVIGMESSDKIKDRARGTGYATVAIDEAAAFVLQLDEIFTDVIQPAVDEVLGVVILASTPGFVKLGLFWRVTGEPKHNHSQPDRWEQIDRATATRWTVHRWTSRENPYNRDNIQSALEEMIRINPDIMNTPSFQREKLGLWVLDDSKLVYRYAAGRNDYTDLPELSKSGWHRALVCDMGYRPDPLAMAVLLWHDHCPILFVAAMTQKLGLLTPGIVGLVHDFERTYNEGKPFEFYVIDGAEIRAVEEMRLLHDIPWRAADKRGKSDFIEMENSDFQQGFIKVHATLCSWEATETITCSTLSQEYSGLIWDTKALESGKRQEDPACANHGTDCVLYGWRHARAYRAFTPVAGPAYATPEYWEAEEEKRRQWSRAESRRAQERRQSGSVPDPWESEPTPY